MSTQRCHACPALYLHQPCTQSTQEERERVVLQHWVVVIAASWNRNALELIYCKPASSEHTHSRFSQRWLAPQLGISTHVVSDRSTAQSTEPPHTLTLHDHLKQQQHFMHNVSCPSAKTSHDMFIPDYCCQVLSGQFETIVTCLFQQGLPGSLGFRHTSGPCIRCKSSYQIHTLATRNSADQMHHIQQSVSDTGWNPLAHALNHCCCMH